jgi:hypothetical protein
MGMDIITIISYLCVVAIVGGCLYYIYVNYLQNFIESLRSGDDFMDSLKHIKRESCLGGSD